MSKMSNGMLLVGGLAVLLLGFALGRYTSPPAPDADGAMRAAALRAGGPQGEDVGQAIADVMRLHGPAARAAGLVSLLSTLGPDAAPAVGEYLRDPIVDFKAGEAILLLPFWARHQPVLATDWVLSKAAPSYQAALLDSAIEIWATLDPEAAASRVRALALVPGSHSKVAEKALVRGWFVSGKPGLEDYIRDLGVSHERQRALRQLVRLRLQTGESAQDLMAWAEALPEADERYKLAVYRQMATELTLANPADGVAWCEKHCYGPYGSNLLQLVAFAWGSHEGPPVMEWLSEKPAGRDRDRAVKDAYSSWRQRDLRGFETWIEGIGIEGTERWLAPAAEAYAKELIYRDPERALDWLTVMENPVMREKSVVTLVRFWRGRDEAAAEAWLEKSSLSEEALKEARTPLELPQLKPRRSQLPPGTPD